MEGEKKACPFCQGSQVNAPKMVLVRMRELFFKAEERVARGELTIADFKNIKDQLEDELIGYADCSFCDGTGWAPVTDSDRKLGRICEPWEDPQEGNGWKQ